MPIIPDHAFIRPGRPARDNCVRCALSEAEHVRSLTVPQSPYGGLHPELAARVTAAAAASGDFHLAVGASVAAARDDRDAQPDWASWAYRLDAELRQLLGALARTTAAAAPAGATYVNEDRSAHLAPADTMTVISALSDAAAHRGRVVGVCRRCGPGRTCADHAGAAAAVVAYRALSTRLGDDR